MRPGFAPGTASSNCGPLSPFFLAAGPTPVMECVDRAIARLSGGDPLVARTGGGRFIRRPGSASDGPTGHAQRRARGASLPRDRALVERAYREIEVNVCALRFVERFCTLCESENTWPCENRTRNACNSRMSVYFLTCATCKKV